MLQTSAPSLLARWKSDLASQGSRVQSLLTENERDRLTQRLLDELLPALETGGDDVDGNPAYQRLRASLAEIAANFAERGLTPSETALFIMSLKQALFAQLGERLKAEELAREMWRVGTVMDKLGLFAVDTFSITRERLIKSQARAIADLATPVIQVWDRIVALPLVGSIDSARAKDIMENLLDAVVRHEADIVIIDITGVPVVDTQVANRLMRTVEAVRLLGTRSIITGINPIIAQTLVQLGVDLSQLTTKATLRAGLQQAFRDLKLRVVPLGEVRTRDAI